MKQGAHLGGLQAVAPAAAAAVNNSSCCTKPYGRAVESTPLTGRSHDTGRPGDMHTQEATGHAHTGNQGAFAHRRPQGHAHTGRGSKCAHQVGQMGPVKVTPIMFRSGPKEQSPASPLLWLWSGGPWVPVLLRQRGGGGGRSYLRFACCRLAFRQIPPWAAQLTCAAFHCTVRRPPPSAQVPRRPTHLRMFQYVVNAPALGPDASGPPL